MAKTTASTKKKLKRHVKMKTGKRLHQGLKIVKAAKAIFLKRNSVDDVLAASSELGLKKRDILDVAKSWIDSVDD